MTTRRYLVVPLVACILLGCTRTPPSPPPVLPAPDGNKEAKVGKEQTLEELTVWFLIDGVPDIESENKLRSKIRALKDDGPQEAGQSGQYGAADRWFRMSPIRDLEAAAAKIDFGLVLAVDPVDRVILIDATAKPAPRPEKGWPGSKVIDEYIQRIVVKRFENYDTTLVKKLGADKVVTVLMPGDGGTGVSDKAVNASLVKKLQKLAPAKVYQRPAFYGPQKTRGANFPTHYFVLCVVAPVEKVSDVVKALDGAPNLVVDEERRVVIVDYPELKPRWAEDK